MDDGSFTDKNIDLASTTPSKAEALDVQRKTPSTKKTILNMKKSSTIFGVGKKITEEVSKITGSSLTPSHVLDCLICHLNEDGHKNLTR